MSKRRDRGVAGVVTAGQLGALLPVVDKPATTELWLCVLAVLLGGWLVFANNLEGAFVFDDYPAIVDNPDIKSLDPFWALLSPSPNSSPLAARPLPNISVALNYAWGGLDVRGYHIVNNLIHLLASIVLFATVRSTLLLPRFAGSYARAANRYALVVAGLWMVHPLQAEAVDYISQRTETLMGLFYLATLFCSVLAFRAERPQRWYVAAVVACFLGMASKEVMVSAPLLVLLYDCLFVAGSFRVALRKRRVFYGALAGTWGVLVFYQLNSPRAASVIFEASDLGVWDYFKTQLTVVTHYLRLTIWPHPLVLDNYDWPVASSLSFSLLSSTAILGGGLGLTLWGMRRSAWWSFLGVWFFCILAPTSSFLPIVTEVVAERRMYLPLAAVVVLVVFAVDQLFRGWEGRLPDSGRRLKYGRALLFGFAVAALAGTSWERNKDYQTEVQIWTDTVAKRPGNARAQESLAKALLEKNRFGESIEPFSEALRLMPDERKNPELYSYIALAFTELGRFPEAIAACEKALALRPNEPLYHYGLGNSFIRINDLEAAERAFQKAIALDPNFVPAKGNLGMLLLQRGDYAGAETQMLEIRRLEPSNAQACAMFATLREQEGRFVEAVSLYREAVRLAPGGGQESAERLKALLAAHPEASGE